MITVNDLPQAGGLEVHVAGEVTEADYKTVLAPALDRAIETGGPLRVILFFADDVSYSLKAMVQDTELGLQHWSGFDRIAVVAAQGWIVQGVRWLGWMLPGPVQTFAPDQADEARRWLFESLGAIHQTDLGDGVLRVALMGKLDPAVYAEEAQDMSAFLNRTASPRLLLDARQFEGWQGLSALPAHLSLVRRYHAAWDRVAILGDAGWQRVAERVLAQVRDGETRFFPGKDEAAALDWLKS